MAFYVLYFPKGMVSGYDSACSLHTQMPLHKAHGHKTTVAVGCLKLAWALEKLGESLI
jgi:hypothetical protein